MSTFSYCIPRESRPNLKHLIVILLVLFVVAQVFGVFGIYHIARLVVGVVYVACSHIHWPALLFLILSLGIIIAIVGVLRGRIRQSAEYVSWEIASEDAFTRAAIEQEVTPETLSKFIIPEVTIIIGPAKPTPPLFNQVTPPQPAVTCQSVIIDIGKAETTPSVAALDAPSTSQASYVGKPFQQANGSVIHVARHSALGEQVPTSANKGVVAATQIPATASSVPASVAPNSAGSGDAQSVSHSALTSEKPIDWLAPENFDKLMCRAAAVKGGRQQCAKHIGWTVRNRMLPAGKKGERELLLQKIRELIPKDMRADHRRVIIPMALAFCYIPSPAERKARRVENSVGAYVARRDMAVPVYVPISFSLTKPRTWLSAWDRVDVVESN